MTSPAAGVAARGRAMAESLMRDTCVIFEPGDLVFDPDSPMDTAGETIVFEGKCRVRPISVASDVDVGESNVELIRHQVSVPFSVAGVEARHHVRITASVDPSLVGKVFVVRGIARGTDITARRLTCEEVA